VPDHTLSITDIVGLTCRVCSTDITDFLHALTLEERAVVSRCPACQAEYILAGVVSHTTARRPSTT